MKNSIRFYHLFSAELLKTKNNLAQWLLLLFPFFFSMLIFIYVFFKADLIPFNPWLFVGNYIFGFYSFLYPLAIALVVASFMNIEYNSLGFKHLFTLPVFLPYIYFAKILNLFLLVFCSTLIAYISYKLGCIALQILRPELNFQDYDSMSLVNLFFIKMFLSLVCITLIQFLLSIKFSNFILPIGIAFVFTLFFILFNFEYSYLIPYRNIYTALNDLYYEDTMFFKKEMIVTLIYIPVFFTIGRYFLIKKKDYEKQN